MRIAPSFERSAKIMGNSEREWAKSYDRNSTKRKVEAVPGIHRAVRAKAASDLAEADVELRRFHPSAALGRRPPPPRRKQPRPRRGRRCLRRAGSGRRRSCRRWRTCSTTIA